ncbi:MAG TPA: pantoate--beta-alanine ligase, partial [bacterium]|nr:pantoate--beta-alanine ligase [bacterium]
METVYIALGSNVGDRHAHLRTALERLALVPGVEVARVSPWLETDFVGDGPAQPRFLNGVAELRSALTPAALHAVLQQLEVAAGRRHPHPRNHPRELDLDVLFFGDRRIDTRALRVPHPRWHEREFVLRPLRELGLDPDALPRFRAPTLLDRRDELLDCCGEWLAGGCTIGLVPTMGSLHEGHRSLMEIARDQCDRVLATVFVNPLQFGPNEDFAAYPRDLDGDLAVCRDAGVDVLFAPSQEQMFPTDFASHVAVGREAEGMEGACRPGHFAGVATVVARLFAMVRPHRAYFGEKDAQQLAVVRRMTRELGFPVQVVPCPIVREPDGLARSSRNVYLCADDRRAARVLYRALTSARERFRQGLRDRDRLLQHVREVLAGEPRCQVDYVELRREGDLAELPPGDVAGGRVLVAGRFTAGERPVRLL